MWTPNSLYVLLATFKVVFTGLFTVLLFNHGTFVLCHLLEHFSILNVVPSKPLNSWIPGLSYASSRNVLNFSPTWAVQFDYIESEFSRLCYPLSFSLTQRHSGRRQYFLRRTLKEMTSYLSWLSYFLHDCWTDKDRKFLLLGRIQLRDRVDIMTQSGNVLRFLGHGL